MAKDLAKNILSELKSNLSDEVVKEPITDSDSSSEEVVIRKVVKEPITDSVGAESDDLNYSLLDDDEILEDGTLVDNSGTPVMLDEDGNRVDDEGRLIDEDGCLVDSEGNFIDEDGEYIDEDGNRFSEMDDTADLPMSDDDDEDIAVEEQDDEDTDANVSYVDEEGFLVNSDGAYVDKSGELVDVEKKVKGGKVIKLTKEQVANPQCRPFLKTYFRLHQYTLHLRQ